MRYPAPCTWTPGSGPSRGASASASRAPRWLGLARGGRRDRAPRPPRLAARRASSRAIRSPASRGRWPWPRRSSRVRGALEYGRTMAAHRTAARVQARLRGRLYEHVTALGPAHFTRARTGDVILSMVEGVQQLEVYFGQYLPQLFGRRADARSSSSRSWPSSTCRSRSCCWWPRSSPWSLPRSGTARTAAKASRARRPTRLRRRVPRLDPGARHAHAFGQSAGARRLLDERGPRALPAHHVGARHQYAGPRHHRHRHRAGRGGRARLVAPTACRRGQMELAGAARDPDARRRGLPPAARAAHGAPPGHARPLRGQAASWPSWLRSRRVARPCATPGARRAREPLAPTVALRHVTFSLPGRAPRRPRGAQLRRGRRASGWASSAPSGAGKSTVARLLLRFARSRPAARVPSAATTCASSRCDQLRRLIAVVSQDTYLFHGTVEDNLRMGKPDATPAELDGGRARANADEFIVAPAPGLPHGGRRARRAALRRAAAAHRDRPRAAPRRARS